MDNQPSISVGWNPAVASSPVEPRVGSLIGVPPLLFFPRRCLRPPDPSIVLSAEDLGDSPVERVDRLVDVVPGRA